MPDRAPRARSTTLRRPWFAGGTVNFASVQGRRHILSPHEAGFEDGTLNYLAIPAVEIGLRYLQRIGLETIHTRVECLTGWLLGDVNQRHPTGIRAHLTIGGISQCKGFSSSVARARDCRHGSPSSRATSTRFS